MAVKHEIKSQLAKLLATEDLIIEHKQIETAQFNVQTRVLILPLWEKATNIIYDSLVAHEVGHALYTPDREWWKEKEIPHTFLNIVEDARIEKLMKRRYAGLAKTFYKGYNELNDLDFFDINDQDLTTFNLADRINLYFKVGAWNDISFSDAETSILRLIENAETFDDTLSAAEALYNFCKQEKEEESEPQEQKIEGNARMDSEGDRNSPDSDSDDTDTTVPESNSDAPVESRSDSDVDNNRMDGDGASVDSVKEPETRTVESLDKALKNLVNEHSRENVYVEIPELNLDDIILSNEDIHKKCELNWSNWEYNYKETIARGDLDLYGEVDSEYRSFKKSAQKEVNFLVKEFEMKKSADSYARSTIAKTGILNTSKLHTYKFNEDLFKKVNVVPDGKNHGLIFILDWSGSMAEVMTDTLKQLYNLIWFCKKVNIPFDVYGFTNEALLFNDDVDSEGNLHDKRKPLVERKGVFAIENYFGMLHLFTSKVNNKVLDQQLLNIYRTSESFRRRCYYRYPQGLHLSGTPLNESIIALHQILPKFKEENKLQKVQCVILTDGEAYPLRYYREVERRWEDEPFLGTAACGDNVSLRDRKLGKTYNFSYEYYSFTDTMLRNLGDKFPDTNFIGMRIMSGRDAGSFIRRYIDPYKEEKKYGIIMKSWKTNKSFSIKDSGYSTYFGLLSNSLSEDDSFEVNEDATKAQIKRAFVKSLKTKKLNKKVLGEFVEMVV
jgi:hypothetical protein